MGYTWRWWAPLRKVRELLAKNAVGKIRHVQFHMSAHLADWHPWERYQDFFMARREMGGGALLDESHWIDLMLWLFGMPSSVSGRIEKISDLEIDSDDNVDLLFAYDGGPRVSMHLDLYGRPHEKFIRFVGSEGTLFWSADPNQIRVGRGWQQEWETESFTCERNDMFVDVAKEFLDVLEGKPPATCSIEDGVRVLEVVEAARRASKDGRAVSLESA
jgi:predicted dehydrogenase